jgi:hypothetical protein
LLRREDHPRKLGHGGNELNPDSGEKRLKRIKQRSVVQLQQHRCNPDGS